MKAITSFKGKYAFLSNFYLVAIEYKGDIYNSVENAYQASKFLSPKRRSQFQDWNMRPGRAKRLGRKYQKYRREDWFKVNRRIMKILHRKKFKHKDLREKLLATDRLKLIEENWWGDIFWGVCNGIGKNYQGKSLMEVREEIRNGKRR